jgi:hypothetical protein
MSYCLDYARGEIEFSPSHHGQFSLCKDMIVHSNKIFFVTKQSRIVSKMTSFCPQQNVRKINPIRTTLLRAQVGREA